ncbi:MAG TPA: ABC transporter substrate-binding protein [Solirubrobacteraceae bacterium]|nr:ABC transporter substrate-binding protein [Solirubrobacteraceae bacterium]
MLALAGAAAAIAGCGATAAQSAGGSGGSSSAPKSGTTVDVGVATTLSGTFASLGQPGLNGIKLEIAQLNQSGGLLGKKLKLVTADDQIDPATGATVTRNLILNDHVVALFGAVSSAVAAAQEQLATQYNVPVFFHIANDIGLTTTHFSKDAYEISPNTDMEPAAAALAFARAIGKGPVRIATITPDYSFGLDTVSAFLKDLKADGVSYTVTSQQTPQLGATSFTSNLAALLASRPQYVFSGQYGGDLVTLTKQGLGLGLFSRARVGAMYDLDALSALGAQAPAGSIAWDRAAFWADSGTAMKTFVNQYKAAYGSYPDEWAVNGYVAAQTWAYGVKKAGSFDPSKLAGALAGATVPTARGAVTIRACDHQAEVPENTGTIGSSADPQYGLRLWGKLSTPPVSKILNPCAAA